ncbi:MAG: energy transducer TonB, partial [Ignavibacteriales bacterium]
ADITTITFNNDTIGSDLTVICPPELESQVISALNQIDVKRKEVKVPLKMATYQKCNALRVFINELTGVPVSKLHISSDLADAGSSAPSKEYVLWIEESPDTVKKVQDVLAQAGV